MRPPCGDKFNQKTTAGDDKKILSYVSSKHGTGNLNSISEKTGVLKRCGKNCKVRWNNCMRAADPKHGGISFTAVEEDMIIKLHAAIGSRWSIIAQQLPGRTDTDVKNYWNTKLRKKLKEMGIDPVTHKPYSQILADYVNIGGNSSRSSHCARVGSIYKDLKATIAAKRSSAASSININAATNYTHKSTATTAVAVMTTSHYPASQHINICARNNDDDGNNNAVTSGYDINDGINHHRLDLFSQLQAITLVTGASQSEILNPTMDTHPTNFLAQIQPPTKASSSASMSHEDVIAPDPFGWHDFLLEDAFLPTASSDDHVEAWVEEVMNVDVSSSTLEQSEITTYKRNNNVVESNRKLIRANTNSASSAGGGDKESCSFVEELLDQESNMFLDFPSLVPGDQEPLYY